MKVFTLRQFTGFALFFAVLGYLFIGFKMYTTGWYNNVTLTSMLFTFVVMALVGMVLWNLVVYFFKTKKETKK